MPEKELKVSQFNHFYALEEQERYFVYNAVSGGLAELQPDLYSALSSGRIADARLNDAENEAVTADLVRGSILVDSDIDELRATRFKLQLNKYLGDQLHIIIVTTHACNLDCPYCYQHQDLSQNSALVRLPSSARADAQTTNRPTTLTESDAENILQFLRKQREVLRFRRLYVMWYGGEPLLNLRIIRSLSQKILTWCSNEQISYRAKVITNGTCFTPSVAAELAQLGVYQVQITIDGPKEVHDTRRPYKDNTRGSSFDMILTNITEAYGILPIVLRVNVDDTNYSHIRNLFEQLKAKGLLNDASKLDIGIANTRSPCNQMTPDDFASMSLSLEAYAETLGLTQRVALPPQRRYCPAVGLFEYVIEPGGNYHTCLNNVGRPERYMGNICDSVTLTPDLLRWLQYDVVDWSPKCGNCNFLPICGGACPELHMTKPEYVEYNCAYWKRHLTSAINRYIRAQCLPSCAVTSVLETV